MINANLSYDEIYYILKSVVAMMGTQVDPLVLTGTHKRLNSWKMHAKIILYDREVIILILKVMHT